MKCKTPVVTEHSAIELYEALDMALVLVEKAQNNQLIQKDYIEATALIREVLKRARGES